MQSTRLPLLRLQTLIFTRASGCAPSLSQLATTVDKIRPFSSTRKPNTNPSAISTSTCSPTTHAKSLMSTLPTTTISAGPSNRRPLSHAHTPHIPVIKTLAQLRRWRRDARARGLEVGIVPTMGALHQGHLNLVKKSLSRHPLTVMTLFVNPMQFAPHEDLSSYPRTFERDLDQLRTLLPTCPQPAPLRGLGISENDGRPLESPFQDTDDKSDNNDWPLVVFAPTEDVMYPLRGELQNLEKHKGVSVDVKGWGDVMEGSSRPQFFKGVATVCTKLFNAVEPDHAYFGQKDIQQALLLKIMVNDLLLSHPSPDNLHIVETTRDPKTKLALSSRNAYLTPAELKVAPVVYRALSTARDLLLTDSSITGEDMVAAATKTVMDEQRRVSDAGEPVEIRLDYFQVFDKHTFEPVRGEVGQGTEMVIAGAVWVGRTRLIDNLLIGWHVE